MTDLSFFTLHLVTVLSAVSSQLLQTDVYDYCSPEVKLCESVTDHTMCRYPVKGLSNRCTPSIQEDLASNEKKRILFWHNKFRSNVATASEKNKFRKLPTASNMRQMYWDDELERIAERWASQCTSTAEKNVYDTCRNTKRFQVSQSVGTRKVNGSTIEKQAPQMIITWYKEGKNLDPSLVDAYLPLENDRASRQFTNLIWADTYAVGCARVIFQEKNSGENPSNSFVWTIERLVCNYGPGGNQTGKRIYKRGTPCEECPEGTHCSSTFSGLCALQNDDKLEKITEGLEMTTKVKKVEKVSQEPSQITTSGISDQREVKTTEKAVVLPGGEDYNSIGEEVLTKDSPSAPTDFDYERPEGRDNDIPKYRVESILKNSAKGSAGYNSIAKDDGFLSKKQIRAVRRNSSTWDKDLSNGDKCTCMEVFEGRSSALTGNIFVLMSVTFYFLMNYIIF